MNLPDRIFAIGGAGKAIALKLLDSEWVLREVLQPKPNPADITITILDTAEGEENVDRERINDYRDRIAELKSELRDADAGRTGDISIEYKLITSDIQLSGSIDLLGDDAVPRITGGNGMDEDNWWLEETHINENLDFAKGVVRKRGLGKAIYYKAYAEDDRISTYIDLPDKGKVAILAGLGGGTGSGIVMDLAQHLQEKQRTAEITLFGILPNHTEGVKESTNAFAALSELEYLSLTGQQVFKDRILMPIDPTGFDGKTGNRIQSDQLLEELDEAVIYLLAAYYNTQNLEDPFRQTPDFAPFTIGIPQVLRYNVEAINEARTALREILSTKQASLEAEEEIYSEINRYLTKNFTGDPDSGLRELDTADLKERLDNAEELLEFDLFQELEYESLSIFNDIISDAKKEAEEIDQQVDIIGGSLRAVNVTGEGTGSFVDDIDEHLADILENDLSMLGRRKEVYEHVKVIDDSRIRDTVEYLIGSGAENVNPGVKLQRLEAQLEELRERHERLKDDLHEAEAELEELRDEQADQIDRQVTNWKRQVEDNLEQLQRITDQPLESDLSSLQADLENYANRAENSTTIREAEELDAREIRETLNRLEDELEAVDIQFGESRRAIEASLSALKQARIAFLKMNEEEGTFEKITPWTSSAEEEREEAHKDYRMQKNELDNQGVFTVGPPTGNFTADAEFDKQQLLTEYEDRQQQLEREISDELRTRLDNPSRNDIEELEARLSRGASLADLGETARRAFRAEVQGTSDIEQRKDELQEDLDETADRIEVFESTIELFQNLNERRDAYVNNRAEFNKRRREHDDESTQGVSTRDEEYVYVKNIQPEDVFRATGEDNLADSELFKSREENQRVRNNLEELAENARGQQYTGLSRRKFSRDRSRYDGLKIRAGVLSRAIDDIDPDAMNFEGKFSSAFDLGASGKRVESPYTTWQRDIGGSWDIGLSIFIDGVFLDNIRKVVQADGYHNGYERRREELGDNILVHHSFGLDEGFYTRRNSLLNLEDDDDVDFLLRDEQVVVNDLLDDYVEKVPTGGEVANESIIDD